MDASESMYQKAVELHHEDGDIEAATELYREILQQYPSTDTARKVAEQLASINDVSDEELDKASDEAASRGATRTLDPAEDGSRHTTLRLVSGLFKVLAVFNLIAGFVTALVATSDPQMDISGVWIVLAGLLSALFCWAIADSIRVLLEINDHARRAVELLESRTRSPDADNG